MVSWLFCFRHTAKQEQAPPNTHQPQTDDLAWGEGDLVGAGAVGVGGGTLVVARGWGLARVPRPAPTIHWLVKPIYSSMVGAGRGTTLAHNNQGGGSHACIHRTLWRSASCHRSTPGRPFVRHSRHHAGTGAGKDDRHLPTSATILAG